MFKQLTGRKQQRGVSVVEFMIVAPVLVLLMLGTVDFGRVMYAGMTVTSAARAGAGYGAQTGGTAVDYTGIKAASMADATDLPVDANNTEHVTVTPRRFCRCINTPGDVDCTNNTCPVAVEVYIKVSTTRDFHTLVPYPLIPKSIQLSRSATMRVQ